MEPKVIYDPSDEVVSDGFECPWCGEPRVDWLVLDADGSEDVHCQTCGGTYNIETDCGEASQTA